MTDKLIWIFSAFGMLLVFEGILPFASPRLWKQSMQKMLSMGDDQIRHFGFALMVLGSLIIWFLHG